MNCLRLVKTLNVFRDQRTFIRNIQSVKSSFKVIYVLFLNIFDIQQDNNQWVDVKRVNLLNRFNRMETQKKNKIQLN
jgi:hypothetical protein